MVHENATNAFAETKKIKKEVIVEVKDVLKRAISKEEKILKLNKILSGKGIKFKFNETNLFINSGGDYSTTYSFNL